jgi:ATP-binding cassette, subfamily C, bacterial CydC
MTSTFRRVLALARAPRGRFALAVGLGALTVVFGVGLMATAGYLISRAAERPAILSLTVAIVAVRFFGLARPAARYLERLSSHDLALRVLARVRRRVYERMEPLAPGQLTPYRHGDLLARFVADVDALQNLHLRGTGPPLVALLASAVSVGATAAVLPGAAAVLAAGLILAGIVAPWIAVAVGRRAAEARAAVRGRFAADLVETLNGAPELLVFGAADGRIERLRLADEELAWTDRRAALAEGAAEALRLLVTGLTVCGVLVVAIAAHHDGRLDRTLVAMVALLALATFEAVQPLASGARELAATLSAGRRILELTSAAPPATDPVEACTFPDGPFDVALEGVRVRYEGNRQPAVDTFSLRLAPGRRVALVGPSGAGKTTVANLLLRFVDPENGRVTLDGRDVRDYRQEDVRRAVALAGQGAHLFSASIRDNLELGRPEATDEELADALRAARLGEWVASLPEGLDTRVGELGAELSGGQRQRLVLARALLKDSPVLVLDEPTAHLDPPTASRLMEDVFEVAGERAVLLVTHRGEGLDLVDEIVEMAPGQATRS